MKKFYRFLTALSFLLLSLNTHGIVTSFTFNSENPLCPGDSGRAFRTSAAGTIGPFQFEWNNVITPGIVLIGDTVKLTAGTYRVRVRDLGDNSISFPQFFNIINPFSVTVIPGFEEPTCFAGCDGRAFFSVFGGAPPFTYVWDDPGAQNGTTFFTDTIGGLCAGTYHLTVTDNNGCTDTSSVILTEPTQVQPNVSTTLTQCFGDANGTATAVPTGGTGTYINFQWSSSGNNTATETGLAAGTYTVTVTDDDNCTNTETFIINQPAALTTTLTPTPILCFGTNTGDIINAPSGGTIPYTFDWDDLPGTINPQNRNSLFAGSYTVTVSDNNGCTFVRSTTIVQRPDIVIGLTVIANNICAGGNIGEIAATFSGGSSPYSFDWGNGLGISGTGNTSSVTNLASGFYPVTVTDRFNCTKVDSIEITEPSAISISIDGQTDPTCNGGNDGTITISATGGTVALDYSYLWNAPGNPTTAAITGLTAGTFTVTVTDDNGCTATQAVTLNPPVPILPNVNTTLVTCFGGNDGIATSNPTGGTAPYTWAWSTSANTTFIEPGLSAGSFTVTVTDNNGCTGTETFAVGQPLIPFTVSFTVVSNLCFGGSAGSIVTNTSGGVGVLTYNWADLPGTNNSPNRNSLLAGTYNITVTDGNGCTATNSAIVAQRTEIDLNFTQTDILCEGDLTGSGNVLISGGTSPYTYNWAGISGGVGNSTSINGVGARTYVITVTDRFNCVKIDSITITEPPALVITPDLIVNPLCNGNSNGSISITPSGGTLNYTFNWADLPGNSDPEDRTNLAAGNYRVTLTDGNNCTTIFDTTLINPTILSATIDSTRDPSCNGNSDGFISVLASGGTGAYTYAWDNIVSTRTNPNIPSGTYIVTVTDNNGCTTTTQGVLTDPSSVSVTISSTDESCPGVMDGSATANPTGGTGPYLFRWDPNGEISQTIGPLSAGTYTVTVTDNNACTDSQTVVITAPLAVIASAAVDSMVSCNGLADGGATASGVGGTPPYTFNWSTTPPQTSASAINLSVGDYFVTITDNNGCTDSASVTITEPNALTSNITSTPPTCLGINDGTATANISGGTPNYTFAWSTTPTQTTQTATGLGAGTITVTITDANGCSITDQTTLIAPTAVTITLDSLSDVSCNGGNDGYLEVSASNGTAPYTFAWSNSVPNAVNPNLIAGTYTIVVTDNNGCTNSQSFIINQPAVLNASLSVTDQQCFGDPDGEITANPTGGTAPYTFNWLPNVGSTATISNLNPGFYLVTVTDFNGCTTTANGTVGFANPRTVLAAGTDVSCNGGNDGGAAVVAFGGAGGFTFNWSDIGVGPQIRTGLTANTYFVTVTDANGCTDVETVIVNEPDTLKPNLTITDVSCGSTNDGTATVNPSGGTGAYTFNWNIVGTIAGNTVTNVPPGSYSVTVTDANGCDSVEFFNIIQEIPDFTLNISSTNVACFGDTTGTISTSVIGGTGPFTFTWNPVLPNQGNQTSLGAGTYQLTVSDPNGCTRDTSIIISQPNLLVVNGTSTDETCSPGGDGTITLSVSGGTPLYTYLWNPPLSNSPNQNGLSGGTYFVTVTDNNGCTDSTNVIVGSQGIAFTINLNSTDISCNGAADGSILVTENPASVNYVYSWTGGLVGNNPTVLTGGKYFVTVTDTTSGCTQIDSATILEPTVILPTLTVVSAGCGASSGSVTSNPTGGDGGPYSWNWNIVGTIAGNTVTNVPPGSYSVTVTDNSSCTAVEAFNVNTVNSNIIPNDTVDDATCNGVCDGEIALFPSGGTAPYFFNWGGGITTPSRTNLCAGTYLVTITDNTNCDTVVSIVVGEPLPFVVNITTIEDTCVTSVGSATATSVTGGTSPYSFDWPPSGTSAGNTVTDLAAGTYDVTVTDDVMCSAVVPFTIGNISPFSVSFTSKDVKCFGGNDGEVDVIVAGGTGPMTYDWTGGITGPSDNMLTAGSYTLTVTDATGCGAVNTVTIGQPDPILANITTTSENCIPGNDGTATASVVTGGTGAYTFNWPPIGVSAGNSVSGLPANTNYLVTITDANGCSIIETFDIGSSASFTVNSTVVDASCNGAADGSITISTVGATNPLTYTWNPVLSNSPNQPNLPAGSYNLTVTDATTCTETASFTIAESDALSVTVNTTDESCLPGTDGTATTVVSGGTTPYTYAWSSSGATTPGDVNLVAGPYDVTVTDNNGCSAIANFVINTGSSIDANPTLVRPTCFGDCDGSITLAPSGGNAPYTFLWGAPIAGNTNAFVPALCAGRYEVTITDNDGCSKTQRISLGQPGRINSSFSEIPESCSPGADGSVTATAFGGTSPYTFDWGLGQTSLNSNGGYIAGNYSVTIFDANNCQETLSFTIGSSPAITVSTIIAPGDCIDPDTIKVSVANATNPLTYDWDTPPLTGATPAANPGTYTITVTDGNGCTDEETVTVLPTGFPINETITDISCNGLCDGRIDLFPSGGVTPYTFNWSTVPPSSGTFIDNLCSGPYTVTVSDNTGCSTVRIFNINDPSVIAANTSSTNESCNPGGDGTATAAPTGGTGTYTYLWSFNNETTSTINGLVSGTYTVTVTDVNGCTSVESVDVNGGGNIVANETITDASCNGLCDGGISLNPSGGASPYTFNWSTTPPSNGSSISAQCAGSYTVTITDNTNCSSVQTFDINQPDILAANISTDDESCIPGNDGSASSIPTGGTGAYTYLWSFNNETTSSINFLTAGSYTLTLTDANNCSVIESITINSGANIIANESIDDASCNGVCDGEIRLFPSGGTGNYTFNWSTTPPLSSSTISAQCAGSYTVTITDNTGCSTVQTYEIKQPDVLDPNVQFTNESCAPGGDGFAISNTLGGTLPYTYLWSFNNETGPSISSLVGGTYTVTVTDGNNCSATETINIGSGGNIQANELISDASCNGVCDGEISVTPTGGIGNYTYSWSTTPAITDSLITAQCAGSYTVTITDNTGCSLIQTYDIDEPQNLAANAVATNVSCIPGNDGTVSSVPTGGTTIVPGIYSYLWSFNGSQNSSITGLNPGPYTVTVTDDNNCTVSQTVDVLPPAPIVYTISSTNQSCNGGCDGTADISIPGGTVGFSFNWDPVPGSGAGTANISDLCVGKYKVTITSVLSGCTEVDSITVNPSTPILPNETFGNEICGGSCDGFATVAPTGGVGTYTYVWTPVPPNGQGNPTASGLCPGVYDIQILDGAGCDTTISFTINAGTVIAGNIGKEDQSCGGISPCDGMAFVDPSGGIAPYTYNWTVGVNTNAIGDTAINLCNGNYDVTITDANGCSIIESTTITSPIAIDTTFIVQNSTCTNCDGSLTVNPTGGTAPYTFSWFDSNLSPIGSGTNNVTSLCAGIYFVDIEDNTGCSKRFAKSISDINSEIVTVSKIDVSCFNGNNGEATASFNCTDPNCSILWLDGLSQPLVPSVTTPTATNLVAGTYFVEVTNNTGCKRIVPVTIDQPDEILISETIVDASCSNSSDGSISISVIGGLAPYSYSWSPSPGSGQNTPSISGLNPVLYTVTVSDANSCLMVASYQVGSPAALSASFSTILADCNQSNGSIIATVIGGTISGDYNYQWFDGSNNAIVGQVTSILSNASSGTYILRVRDDNSCEDFFTTSLGNIGGPSVIIDSIRNITCSGGNDGAIFISASDPSTPLTFNWLPFGQGSEDITNLTAGTYTVEVSNASGCLTSKDTTIISSPMIVLNAITEDATCGLCNGIARLSVNGGVGPYTYLWSNGSTVDTTANLCAGAQSVVVTDANGCFEILDFTINTDTGPDAPIISATSASCFSSEDGSVNVTALGGTAPYTYLWLHNGDTTNSLNNLGAGSYFLLITDVKGCSRNVEVIITSPGELAANETIKAAGCGTLPCDGEARINVSGGTSPYTYSWSQNTGLDTNFVNELCAGIYIVTIADANGCSITKTVVVPNNISTVELNPTTVDVNCFASCDGLLISNVTPTVGISFQWYDNQGLKIGNVNKDTVDAVCAGDYILEVSSAANNCKTFAKVTVGEPDSILLGASIVKNISCNGSCDGEIFISTVGGNILYTYSWDDPSQDGVPATDLCAGKYSVTATDANGCSATTSVTLKDPPLLELIINSTTTLICSSDCDAEADISANGGIAPYSFDWSGGQSGTNPKDLCFGPNIVTITDASGCALKDTVFIGAIDTVFVAIPLDTIYCDGDSIGLNGIVLGSTVSSFAWYESDTTTIFTTRTDTTISRPIGTYNFFLIATNGSCNDTVEFKFSVKDNPVLFVNSTIRIFKEEVAKLEVSGEDNSYIYSWSPSTFLNDSSLAEPISAPDRSITYTLTVIDTNDCKFIDSTEVIYTTDIKIPSGLSPNGDGTNDTWSIEILEEFPNAKVQVYNRWGELIYEQNNGYNKEWDGTYEGKALPIGTYYYIIDLKSDRLDPITGPITIVR